MHPIFALLIRSPQFNTPPLTPPQSLSYGRPSMITLGPLFKMVQFPFRCLLFPARLLCSRSGDARGSLEPRRASARSPFRRNARLFIFIDLLRRSSRILPASSVLASRFRAREGARNLVFSRWRGCVLSFRHRFPRSGRGSPRRT